MKFLGFLLAVCLLVACAKDKASMVNQSAIYTSYSMSYDDSTKAFHAAANFNFGGSTGTYLMLDGNSSVTFDGKPMKETHNAFNQVIYEFEDMPSELWTTHTFFYADTNGGTYKNSHALPSMPQASYPSLTVKMTDSLIISWATPDKIGPHGSLYAQVTKVSGPGGGREFSPGDISNSTSGTVTLGSNDLTLWGAGGINVQVCRQNLLTSIPAPSEGGILTLTTCTDKTTVEITN